MRQGAEIHVHIEIVLYSPDWRTEECVHAIWELVLIDKKAFEPSERSGLFILSQSSSLIETRWKIHVYNEIVLYRLDWRTEECVHAIWELVLMHKKPFGPSE